MNFDCLSPTEVRQRYENAHNKAEILQVLADLTCSTNAEVAEFLGVNITRRTRAKVDSKRALIMYHKGMTDSQIAARLGCTGAAVCKWRGRQDLPTNNPNVVDDKKRLELYRNGLSDREAAKALGISRTAYRMWRNKHNLKPNVEKEINA